MSDARQVKLSKFLSLVLRHDPGAAFVQPDAGGWVPVAALLEGMARAGLPASCAELETVVAQSPKKRFTLSEDGARIRAAQGHSFDVDLGLVPTVPPSVLFHGTAQQTAPAILAEGLKPSGRRFVHLSPDVETARTVGARHGKPVVFDVDTAAAQADGVAFFRAENGVWLARGIPPHALKLSGEARV